MRRGRGLLLTGGTGLLGRFLLRDLLLAGQDVAVLARDAGSTPAQRVEDVIAFWEESLGVRLERPVVLTGDVSAPNLGLSGADRAWLGRSCQAVLHAAAHVGFAVTADGEPWETNLEGVRYLRRLCGDLGIDELHHVSTAYVCGHSTGTVREDDLDRGQAFHNPYEQSKFEAERLLRQAAGPRVTVYRPSVLVGDSRSGYTSTYHGFYRFVEVADRLAQPRGAACRSLPLRLPFRGDEPRNLVPVDWAAAAISHIVRTPRLHGATYHLASRQPVATRFLVEVLADVLGVEGVSLAGRDEPADPSALEKHFLEQVRDYWPYRDGEPCFDCTNTETALPFLPPPVVDRALLSRLVRFPLADRWGRGQRRPRHRATVDCAHYVEEFFPRAIERSSLAGVLDDVTIGLDVLGPAGGQWTCRWVGSELFGLQRGVLAAPVVYRLAPGTFAAVVTGRVSVQEAFFARQIDIVGDVEKGLKLAALFTHLVRECPYPSPAVGEEEHVAALHV
jgi:thioester reductase-like protein